MARLEFECEWEVEGLSIMSPGTKETELYTPRYINNSKKNNDFNDTFLDQNLPPTITLENMKDVIDSVSSMDDTFIIQLNCLIQLYNTDMIKERTTSKKKKHSFGPLEMSEREAFLLNIREFTGFNEFVVAKMEQLIDVVKWTFLKKMMSILGLTSDTYTKPKMLSQIIDRLKYPLKINDTNLSQFKQNNQEDEACLMSPQTTPHSLYDKDSVITSKADMNTHLSFDHNCFTSPALHAVPGFDDSDLDLLYSLIE